MGQKTENLFGRESMQPTPERAALRRSPAEEERLTEFNAYSMTTKGSVLAHITDQIEQATAEMVKATGEKLRYFSVRRDYLEKFYTAVSRTILFERLEPWWAYEYHVSSRGIVLKLAHTNWQYYMPEHSEALPGTDTSFTVVEVKAKALTIDEYAADRGIKPGAVRQSLRRGKIRTAYKMGQEWRIPELAQTETKRGYTTVNYQWSEELVGLPDGFEYLKGPTGIQITQEDDDKGKYRILVTAEIRTSDNGPYHSVTQTEMERLEPFLIANPYVIYCDDEQIYRKKVSKDDGKKRQ